MRILIIEGIKDESSAMQAVLQAEGFQVETYSHGKSGLASALREDYALVIVEARLADIDGVALVSALRSAGRATRIMVVSENPTVEERIAALNAGADDLVSRPIHEREFLAHAKALLRRTPLDISVSTLRFEDLELDTRTHYVTRAGKRIKLPMKQFSVLEYLMRNPHSVVTRQDLARDIWSSDPSATNNVIDVTVHLLRESLDKGFDRPVIQTVRGVG
ncbi:MAG: response regulator transcription factor [Verrucomicrobia bacterium]|nr:response regulator transcription factor [Verrucomicrobiota bacterium]